MNGYLDGESYGVEVVTKSLLLAAVLLHESHQEGAAALNQRVVVHVLQLDGKLGVGAEGGCAGDRGTEAPPIGRGSKDGESQNAD
ncbi:hypothetical protein COCON_G00227570 [Conger conger]|uniref:Uncharacterized protein n=1 Tax=Conger conger TaxID=82655 RepID=A0A9Q1CWH2_CONCO|nr:hypothetical protein COCON_G00227570 [Conger conger]